MEVKGSEAQGRHREVGSEGSVEQRYGPMDKNRIRGLRRRTSEPMIAKSVSIKDAGGKSGGRVSKAVELIAGESVARLEFETEGGVIHSDPAAEVSSGRSTHASEEGPNSRERQVGRRTRRRPQIRLLSIGPYLCSTLPSDPTSRW